MELRQLRYFVKAKELLNFTAAAHQLHVSQSTLSQGIKQLEDELGIPLFDRIGKRIALTEAGRLFYTHALQTVHKADAGVQVLQDLNDLQTGEVVIGVTYGLRHILTQSLIQFAKQYPRISIRVVFGTSEELMQRLGSLEFDFVLSFEEAEKEKLFNYQVLFDSPMTLVAPKHSILVSRTQITLKEISQLPLALPAKGYSTREFISSMFDKYNLSPVVSLEINDIPTLIELVKTGNWHTILSQYTVSKKDDVITIPISGKNMRRKAMLISLKETYQKKAVTNFYQLIEEIAKTTYNN